jgi:hypothetical protein
VYIDIIIITLDIIHYTLFYLKHNVLETGFCIRIQAEPTQLGPIDRASVFRFHLKTETESTLRNDRTMDNAQNCDM